ncbi:hypothetical protein C0993_001252 [Termitomyces sp. T159_Od127]|nr:hypothetical protein C0993_001252 [Termitomyces sp. T159_Od127]
MADFGIGVASGVAFEIVKSIVAYAKEVQVNKAQAKQLSKNCETRLDQYTLNFQRVVANVEGLARSPSYDILDNSFKEFTSVLRTLEADMEKWAKLGFWQRLAQKREMECSIQAFNRDLDGAWQVYQNHLALQSLAVASNLEAILLQARLEDAQNDAELMSNTAKTLKKYGRPITTYVGMSCMDIAAEFRWSNLDEDPKLKQARRELREALESYEGSDLPYGIDSSELTLMYEQPVRMSANSMLYKGLRKGATVAIKKLRFEGYTDDLAGQINTVFKRITHEADLWKDLNHPNIMKFLGCCRPQGEFPFLVSPWMEHGDARTYLHAHPDGDCLKWVSTYDNE